jgi:hypothetical protein
VYSPTGFCTDQTLNLRFVNLRLGVCILIYIPNVNKFPGKIMIKTKNLIKRIAKIVLPTFLIQRLGGAKNIEEYRFKNTGGVKQNIIDKYGFNGDLLDIFVNNKDKVVSKWHHYIPIYDRYLSKYRKKKVRILEIGVSKGGSLVMWRKYFGDEAIIFGIDIDPDCGKLKGIDATVRIGSQVDPEFLESVVNEMGGIDIVIDDGGHKMSQISKSFNILFPTLNDGGLYIIEDLHTVYWRNSGGGYHSQHNFFNFLLETIHDMHHWYHFSGVKHPNICGLCPGIHFHDSLVVLEKSTTHEPAYSEIS